METTTKPSAIPAIPTKIGTPFEGGFYAGRFYNAGKAYALIVSPKSTGEQESIAWGPTDKIVEGALSYSDGLANTLAMSNAGSALAKWAFTLKIGDFNDWYLPSRLESLVLFGEMQSLKSFAPNKPNGIAHSWYWTSTQSAGDAGYAWCQGFVSGLQGTTHKSSQLRARAVRRFAI